MVRVTQCIPITGTWIPDRVAGRALAEGKRHGRIAMWFDWGEYAIWHLSPSLRVSLDGRRETIYSDTVLLNHEAMNRGTAEGVAYLERLDPEYVWMPARFTELRNRVKRHGYRLDVETAESFVAVREDQPVLKMGSAPPDTCFPGP
jgi:hypothetical protein